MLLDDPSCTSISVFSRNPTSNIHPSVTYHACDISDSARVRALLAELQPKSIIHTSSPRVDSKPALIHAANVLGTINLLKYAAETPSVKAFVYTSSDSAMHPSNERMTEDDCIMYTADDTKAITYQRTKAMADTMVLKANSPALRTATLRLPTVYGEGDPYFIMDLIEQLRKGQNKIQVGNNTTLRESVYVDSAASGHILAAKALLIGIENPNAPKVDGEAFLLSDGVALPLYDLMRKGWKVAGDETEMKDVKVIPMWVVMLITGLTEWVYWVFTFGTKEPKVKRELLAYLERGAQYDLTKAKERLGYKPLVTVDEGMKRSMEWAMEEERKKR
jgi:sterol-4alpha-carboxylate 3-dehydrogenase (decarboxylating)